MRIIVCLIILLNLTPAYADFTTYTNRNAVGNNFNTRLKMNQPKTIISGYSNPRPSTYNQHHCPQCHYFNQPLSKKDLNALEKYALNKTYRTESDLQRLERLENLAFGTTQYGDMTSRYQNVENAILSRPQYNQKRSVLNNIASYYAGQTTGFTPNLMPYNNLGGFSSNPYAFTPTPGYNNNSFERYSNGIFGGGWGISGSDYGTGSGVRILP